MLFEVTLNHLVSDLPRCGTEISPGPKVSSPIPFLDDGEFLEQLGRGPPFDPSHDFTCSHGWRSRYEDVNMIFADHTADDPDFEGITRLAHQLLDS